MPGYLDLSDHDVLQDLRAEWNVETGDLLTRDEYRRLTSPANPHWPNEHPAASAAPDDIGRPSSSAGGVGAPKD